jgi:hypothetical protein
MAFFAGTFLLVEWIPKKHWPIIVTTLNYGILSEHPRGVGSGDDAASKSA